MTRSSGLATFQTSLTPSAHTCGLSPASPKWSSATPVRCPWVPSASTVTLAVTSAPGSKFGERLAIPAAALVAGADADRPRALDEQFLGRRLRQDHGAARFGLLGEPARRAVTARRRSCRRCASSAASGCAGPTRRVGSRRSRARPRPYDGMSSIGTSRPRKSRRKPLGLTTAPETRCEPTLLPFSSTATGTSPEPIGRSRATPRAAVRGGSRTRARPARRRRSRRRRRSAPPAGR